MARIYSARQRQSDGRWDMTVASDEENWCHAIGYCCGSFAEVWPEHPRESHLMAWRTEQRYHADRAKALPFATKYHSDGHATAKEAESCYRVHEIDQGRRSFTESKVQRPCEACESWTQRRVELALQILNLCEQHDNPEGIAAALAKRDEKIAARRAALPGLGAEVERSRGSNAKG